MGDVSPAWPVGRAFGYILGSCIIRRRLFKVKSDTRSRYFRLVLDYISSIVLLYYLQRNLERRGWKVKIEKNSMQQSPSRVQTYVMITCLVIKDRDPSHLRSSNPICSSCCILYLSTPLPCKITDRHTCCRLENKRNSCTKRNIGSQVAVTTC